MKHSLRPPTATEDFFGPTDPLPNGKGVLGKTMHRSNDIFLKTCLFKSDTQMLSPIIFTKKVPSLKLDDKMTPSTMMLECLFALVNRFYYKSSFDAAEFVKEVLSTFEAGLHPPEAKLVRRRSSNSVRRSRRIRKNGKPQKQNAAEEKAKDKSSTTLAEENNLLDYLVSPVKTDICFGGLTRTVEHQGTGHFRGGNLRVRKAVRHDRDDGRLNRSVPRTRWRCSSCTTCGRPPSATACGATTSSKWPRTSTAFGTK